MLITLTVSNQSYALFEPIFEDGEWFYELGVEWRHFDDPGEFGQDRDAFSIRVQPEFYTSWNDGDDFFKFTPFLRVDSVDDERTHFDIREGFWGHIGDSWEMKLGVTRVFWGRTEFLNLVDVINQKDFIEGDRDAKLGQPVLQFSFVHDVGILDFYALLGFRERTYAGEDGRLRTPIVVDADNAKYGKGVSENDIGFAARWGQPVGDYTEIAVSIFSGVGREPWFEFNFDPADPKLIPVYYHMEQLGLEVEFIYEGWVAKLEAVGVTSSLENYTAAVSGVEYTFGTIFGTDIDATLIGEYMWDERAESSPGFTEHDFGLGLRFSFNDEENTEILLGGMIDPDTEEKFFLLEASRRLNNSLKLSVQANYVVDRGNTEEAETTVSALQNLQDLGLLSENVDPAVLADLISEYGLLEILTDPTFFLDSLNQLARLGNADRKLSILESDSYIQFELAYFY
ncbi:MAG: hypothetical protein MI976_27790 [Pseudomonadales bacterium]|nr:hypothetical protein [Pseudomonadales bacterium]